MYTFKHKPLDKMVITQPFGVNWVYPGFYASLGLKNDKHNGIDFSGDKMNVYAVEDGWVQGDENNAITGYGINARLFFTGGGKKYEVVYGHLEKIVKDRAVKAGDVIAISDNTGASTGPHVHFGIREVMDTPNGSAVVNYNNGYFGCIDPAQFFNPEWTKLPVELKYGRKETLLEEMAGRAKFAPDYLWFIKNFKRSPSEKEYNALRYGFWPARFVADPAFLTTWQEMTYPEAKKRGIVK